MKKVENEEITVEVAFLQLEELLAQLENKEISLEESFQTYQKGIELLKVCNEKIDAVESKLLLLSENGETSTF